MPELPEVETLRQDLRRAVLGRAIVRVQVAPDAARIIQGLAPAEFCQRIQGTCICDVSRRGKFLIFHLDAEHGYLLVHRRMSGNFLLRPPGAAHDPYTRATFALDDGTELRFTDLRKFGTLRLTTDPEAILRELGPDALDPDLSLELLAQRLAARRSPIKAVLLDQRVIAGLGNLYSDEALHRAGLHPCRAARSLTPQECAALQRGIAEALHLGLKYRGSSLGTSLRDHVNLDGSAGENQGYVLVFQRTGEPCYRCGTPIERIKVGGRSTHYCPVCQPSLAR